jgi:anthranilate synthase component 1
VLPAIREIVPVFIGESSNFSMTMHPSLKEFLELSKHGNVIPVYKEINADLDTPVSAFLKTACKSDYSFLLESVEGREKVARYSFLGHNPALIFQSKGRHIQLIYPKEKKTTRFETHNDPLSEIKKIMSDFKPVLVKGLPRFCGGFVGFIGYDTVRFFEDIPDTNPDTLKLPDAIFLLTDTILIFDHVNHTIKIITNVMVDRRSKTAAQMKQSYCAAVTNIQKIERDFRNPSGVKIKVGARATACGRVTSNFTPRAFKDIVRKAKAHITKGDIIQVVLSQRFKAHIRQAPFSVYRNLRSLNPSPYMFFLKFKDFHLIGASPEMLVRLEGGLVQARPIAGTRQRGATESQDDQLEKELRRDLKERAEHLMLVDLGRNDLGRICKPGSVRVNEFMTVERYSHVMHLVSEVRGQLDSRFDSYDVLRACFPAGTVSGSPKIRAMEIIDELENVRRGPYAGCVGYFSFSGAMDTCITIRTIVIKDTVAFIQAGAGIVADSVPAGEYTESVNKAKALIEAIAQ